MTELQAMRRALVLARRGWGRVHPNPLVGAVILADGASVGEGHHAEFGAEHAERAALSAAGPRARGATLVVSLEPCDHRGQQPPCTEAIVAAGIARVVAAASDPNPVAGGGAARLRAACVEVELGLLSCEARRQNAAFFHRFRDTRRPWVALKLATSLDHRIADASGRSRWISGVAARRYVHWLRAGFAAVGVGGRTALCDNPRLTVRGPVEPRVPPLRILFEGADPLPPALTAIQTASELATLVVTSPEREAATSTRLRETDTEVLAAASLSDALGALQRRGVESLLIEGGGRLAGALLREGLVDRFYRIESPIWLGADGIPATAGWSGALLAGAERWQVVERRALGKDTLLVLDREPCSPES